MTDSKTNERQRQTILVIHNDAAVLVLVRGLLAEHYRVLLAADADSAVQLAMLEGVPMDLALIGRETPGVRNTRELQRRLTSVRPDLRIMSMVGSVGDRCIKIKTVGISRAHRADGFLAQVHRALGAPRVGRSFTSNSSPCDRQRQRIGGPFLVARAGSAME
jgi:CheY-like chemotaxis protein